MNRVVRHGQYHQADRGARRTQPWWRPAAYINRILPAAIRETVAGLRLPPGATVLDYGCADQPYRALFAQQQYRGADLPGNPLACTVVEADSRLPLPDGSVDLVLSSQVLEHVDDPAGYLRESLRVLRPGGQLLLSTHGMMIFHPDPVDYWRWTGQGLRKLLQDAGYQPLSQRGLMSLAACGLQFVQIASVARLPPGLRQAVTLCFQLLIAGVDRLQSDASRELNAMVYIAVARKPG